MATVASVVSGVTSFLKYFSPPRPGQDSSHPLTLKAVPGLATLLDVTLFRSVEGQLTATICSSHALLWAWLDLKHQAQLLLFDLSADEESFALSSSAASSSSSSRRLLAESFARQCLEAASDAIERLSVDKLAQSANLSDPYDSTVGGSSGGSSGHHYHHNSLLSGVGSQGIVSGILEGKEETGRRTPVQNRRDCWESPRLICPDYVWADEAFSTCQRLIRSLAKHPFSQGEADNLVPSVVSTSSNAGAAPSSMGPSCERNAGLLLQLVQDDLPMRLYQFRAAMDAESVVTKRLYLVKCEYRAPFRAFLEAHQSVQRAPSMAMVEEYLSCQSNKPQVTEMRDVAKVKLQKLLETPQLIEVLALEKKCEEMEIEIGRSLFPFSELARSLDHKRARLKVVPGVVEEHEISRLKESVRRLKCILCRKGGPSETSQGIRPILLDLQGVPRDDEVSVKDLPFTKSLEKLVNAALTDTPDPTAIDSDSNVEERVDDFIHQLQQLGTLCKTRNGFKTDRKTDIDLPVSIVKGCNDMDGELLRCQFLDWYDMVQRQQADRQPMRLDELAEQIRRAEMEMSIAVASEQSLEVVRKRLEMIAMDRQKRFDVLKEMVEEVCLREMNLHVRLESPNHAKVLELAETSAVGFLGIPLEIAGEPLPVV